MYWIRLLSILCVGMTMAAQPANFKCLGPPFIETSPPAITVVLHQLKAVKMTETILPDLAATLETAKRFQSTWLLDNRGERQQISTLRNGHEDVLLARWNVRSGNPQIKSIAMWDGALYELMIYEIDPAVLESDESLRAFLLTVVKQEQAFSSGPSAQELHDGFGFRRGPDANQPVHGTFIWRPDRHQIVAFDQMIFTFYPVAGKLFLVFDFGKRAKHESWSQSIYLGDRFPTFATRVRKWKKKQLLREVSQPETTEMCAEYSAVGQFRESIRSARDEVLIAELVRRGLDDQEFRTVIDSVNGGGQVIATLRSSGEVDQYRKNIEQAIRRYEARSDVNIVDEPRTKRRRIVSKLEDLIRALDLTGTQGYASVMLDLIEAGHEPEWALEYIYDHPGKSQSEECVRRLKDARVFPKLEKKRMQLVEYLQSSLQNHNSR